MPVEIIGEAGTPGANREWINAECELAIKHLKEVCGEPPPEMELEVQWQEHELGEYPLIVLVWEDAICVVRLGNTSRSVRKLWIALGQYENR